MKSKTIYWSGGILILLVATFLIFQFGIKEQAFGNVFFDNSNLRVQSTDDKSVTFKVEGTYTGQFGSLALRPETEKQSDIETLSFFMLSSDYPCDTSSCANTGLVSIKYPLTDIQLSEIKGKLNYRTGVETEFSGTITSNNLTGFCSIPDGWVSFTKTSLTPSDVPYDLKQPFGLAAQCSITGGKLRAIDSTGNDVTSEVSFYGNIKGSGKFVALKVGVQCTQNQLSLCGEGEWGCENNQCIRMMVTPPLPPIQELIENETIIITPEEQNLVLEELKITEDTKTISSNTGVSEEKVKFILENQKIKIDYALWGTIGFISLLIIIIMFLIIRRYVK